MKILGKNFIEKFLKRFREDEKSCKDEIKGFFPLRYYQKMEE